MLMAFNSVGELTTDPQLAGEGFFRTVPHDGTTLTDAGPPYRFASGLREGAPAPALGEGEYVIPSGAQRSPALQRAESSRMTGGVGEGPLAGLRVCDFTWVIAGPLHTKWLAAYGAGGRQSRALQEGDGPEPAAT